MKTKKRHPFYVILSIIFVILYIFLAAKPLSKEYHFNPEWKINISSPVISDIPAGKNLIYFKLGQSIGYFTEDGKITNYTTFPSKAAISSDYYATYSTEQTNISFYNNKGIEQGVFSKSGYPYFDSDRIYVFLPGGASFSKCDTKGNTLWTLENTIPITAFNSKETCTVSGYADGNIKLIDNQTGSTLADFTPGGSDYNVILGLDVSSDGKYIASVSGHDKQRFVLTKNDGLQPVIVYHQFLNSDLQRRTLVHFTKDNKRVIYNYENNLGIYNIEKGKNTNIKIDKAIISIEETDSLIFVLGQKGNEYTVYLIEGTDTLEGSFSFTANTAFIKTSGNCLFVGHDSTISKINVTKE